MNSVLRNLLVFFVFFCLGTSLVAPQASAVAFVLRLGPAGVGFGGTNPMGIPPTAADVELSMITAKNLEFNAGLPGLVGGYRAVTKWGGYVALGGGLVWNTNGLGPGAYSAFGIDFGGKLFKMNLEYKQTVGVTSNDVIAPHALRFGGGFWFH